MNRKSLLGLLALLPFAASAQSLPLDHADDWRMIFRCKDAALMAIAIYDTHPADGREAFTRVDALYQELFHAKKLTPGVSQLDAYRAWVGLQVLDDAAKGKASRELLVSQATGACAREINLQDTP